MKRDPGPTIKRCSHAHGARNDRCPLGPLNQIEVCHALSWKFVAFRVFLLRSCKHYKLRSADYSTESISATDERCHVLTFTLVRRSIAHRYRCVEIVEGGVEFRIVLLKPKAPIEPFRHRVWLFVDHRGDVADPKSVSPNGKSGELDPPPREVGVSEPRREINQGGGRSLFQTWSQTRQTRVPSAPRPTLGRRRTSRRVSTNSIASESSSNTNSPRATRQ